MARMMAHDAGEVSASPQDVWRLLIDWAGLLNWWANQAAEDGTRILSVSLEGKARDVPRTRIITVGRPSPTGPSGTPLAEIRETILHEDSETRRIYYRVSDDILPGVRNYFATTTVDSTGEKTCRVSFTSLFDLACDQDSAGVRAIFESLYKETRACFSRYFARR